MPEYFDKNIKTVCNVSSFVCEINNIFDRWKRNEYQRQNSNDPAVMPWFRGITDADFPLVPSLIYMCKDGEEFDEFWINEQFRKKAYLQNDLKIKNEEFEFWLFQSRHHGAPSRLMDWTESALTALFFAVETENIQSTTQNEKDGMVYMMQPFLWNMALGYGYGVPESNMKIKQYEYYVNSAYDQHRSKQFRYYYSYLNRFALAVRPNMMTQRLVAQRGVFTIHGNDLSRDNDGTITEMNHQAMELSKKINDCRKNDLLASIRILGSSKSNIQRELAMMGISRATLFPDMEGLVRDLRFQFKKQRDKSNPPKNKSQNCLEYWKNCFRNLKI